MDEKHYINDARFRRLYALVDAYRKKVKRATGALLKEDEKLIAQAHLDLASIGAQIDKTYLDQLPLLPDVGSRKVVQEK